MIETITALPLSFWVVAALLAYGALEAKRHLRDGLGLPMLTVLGTVTAWYIGDVFYNDYPWYRFEFTPEVLSDAWWEVAIFIVAFLALVPATHRWMNRRELHRPGQVSLMLQSGTGQPWFQAQLQVLFGICAFLWLTLSIIAAIRLKDDVLYYFCPYLGYHNDPWSRERIGSGLDSLLSLAGYLEMFIAGIFGIAAVLMRNPLLQGLGVAGCLITWPYFFFSGLRNPVLVVAAPAILAGVFLRLRGGIVPKCAVLAICFWLINTWFGFIIASRTVHNLSWAFKDNKGDLRSSQAAHHEGLNMYEELCWINDFITNGLYQPNLGQRYFAELVNPIPRALWPGKPMIGIDYSILRGQSYTGSADAVTGTVSTGMIGQGVVNFGRILGPAFAAWLMSLWAAVLARLDLRGQDLGSIPLYGFGLILTFNMGRDITLITLYTFVFGYLVVWCVTRLQHNKPSSRQLSPTRGQPSFENRPKTGVRLSGPAGPARPGP